MSILVDAARPIHSSSKRLRLGLLAAAALLAAPAGALAQPQRPPEATPAAAAQDAPRPADAEILEIYNAVCVRGEEAPAGFQPVEWSTFPPALRLLNTYGHEGNFLLRDAGGRIVYIARTSGAGRDSIVAAERRCGVAIRGANFNRLARAFARQLGVRPLEMNMLGHKVVMLEAPQGVLSVNEAEQGWIIVRAYDVSFR